MDKNIYILGFMGTGKSRVSRVLAKNLNRDFYEMDEIIEKKEGISITEIFSQKGENYFRRLEAKVLKELSLKQKIIVSCGGGVVIDDDNIEVMRKTGVLICLRAKPETILNRVKDDNNRPLLVVPDPLSKITTMLDERSGYYAKCDNFVDTDGLSVDDVAKKVLTIIN